MAQAAAPGPSSPFAIFHKRNFTLLWFSQFLSMAARALAQLAAGFYVYELSGSALDVGLMFVAGTAPSLLVGLVAGVMVDRLDKRRVLVAVEAVRVLCMLAVPLLLPLSVAWLYLLIFLVNCAGQFFEPAHSALIPEVASEEELTAANSLFVISIFGAGGVGFVAGGIIMARLGVEWAFYITAALYFGSMLLVLASRVRSARLEGKTSVGAVARNLGESLGAIGRTPVLRSLFVVWGPTFFLMGALISLVLPFAVGDLGTNEAQYGFLEAAGYLGLALGGLSMALAGHRLRDGQWLALSLLLSGVATVWMALANSFPPALIAYLLSGIFMAPSVVARNAIIQRSTARVMRGRVFSAFFVMRDMLFMLGGLAAGIADIWGVRSMLLLAGGVYMAMGLLAAVLPGLGVLSPDWRRMAGLLRPAGAGAPVAAGLSPARPARTADLDLLIRNQPVIARMDMPARKKLMREALVREVAGGAPILRQGDASSAAYFVLDGAAVAGTVEDGQPRVLEVMRAGDLFGEIAALTGVPRTADVVADGPVRLLEIPALRLRAMADDPEISRLFFSKMMARLARSQPTTSGRFGDKDQDALLDLRTPQPA